MQLHLHVGKHAAAPMLLLQGADGMHAGAKPLLLLPPADWGACTKMCTTLTRPAATAPVVMRKDYCTGGKSPQIPAPSKPGARPPRAACKGCAGTRGGGAASWP